MIENLQPFDWFQNISKISMMGRLQRGHEPRLSHSSLEQTLQKDLFLGSPPRMNL